METILITFSILVIIFIVGGIIWANITERRNFNNGICPCCGQPLRCFDMDSQGGYLWKCDNCGYFTSTSWIKHKNVKIQRKQQINYGTL